MNEDLTLVRNSVFTKRKRTGGGGGTTPDFPCQVKLKKFRFLGRVFRPKLLRYLR